MGLPWYHPLVLGTLGGLAAVFLGWLLGRRPGGCKNCGRIHTRTIFRKYIELLSQGGRWTCGYCHHSFDWLDRPRRRA